MAKEPIEETVGAALLDLSEQLPVPQDYFAGIEADGRIEPTQILCFSRLNAKVLEESSAQHRDYHHRYVLICPLVGTGWIYLDAKSWQIHPGEALFFHPFQFHYFSEIKPEAINWIFVTFEIADSQPLECLRDQSPIHLNADANELLLRVLGYWHNENRRGMLSPCLELLLRLVITFKPTQIRRKSVRTVPHADLLMRVNRAAFKSINRGMGIKELSRVLGFSESRLRSLFRETTGMSLGKHLRRLKILKACELLQRSQLSVGEISECCGFDSVYSFSRAFKHYCRVSPALYRRGVKRYKEDETEARDGQELAVIPE